jgi:hypothetical protein
MLRVKRFSLLAVMPLILIAGIASAIPASARSQNPNPPCVSYDKAVGGTNIQSSGIALKAEIGVVWTGTSGNCSIKYVFTFDAYYISQGDTDSETGTAIEDSMRAPGVPYDVTAAPLRYRIWICGGPGGGQPNYDITLPTFTSGEIQYATPTFKYYGCGPQADNYGSNFIVGNIGQTQTYISAP